MMMMTMMMMFSSVVTDLMVKLKYSAIVQNS